MMRSEQIDTKIWLCCDGNSAAGMLLQKLPDTMNQVTQSEESIEHNVDAWTSRLWQNQSIASMQLNSSSSRLIFWASNLKHADLKDIWEWAISHWDIQHVPKTRAITKLSDQ